VATSGKTETLEPAPLDGEAIASDSGMVVENQYYDEESKVEREAILISSVNKKELEGDRADGVVFLYQSALQAQRNNHFDRAIDLYNEVLLNQPDHVDTLMNLSALYIRFGLYDSALKLLDQLERLRPKDAGIYVNRGIVAIRRQDNVSAKGYLQKALEINPTEKTALINLAWLAGEEKDFTAAKKHYGNLHSLYPAETNLCMAYAHSLEDLDDFAGAVQVYRNCLQLPETREQLSIAGKIKARILLLKKYISENESIRQLKDGSLDDQQQ
jgi:tetratricopeptide (TPR) repeat protein